MIQFGNIKIFTCEYVADQLGVSVSRIKFFIKKGELTARRVGNTCYITEKKLEEFFECASSNRIQPDDVINDMEKIDAILKTSKTPQG